MEDPTGAETSEASDARKEEPCRIMTINMECKGKMLADEEKKLIISTIEGSSASLIFCQKAVGNFKTKVVEKCVKDGSSYQFVPKDIRNRKGKDKVAVMWCETDFEGKEVEDKESSSAMAKLTSKGTTKASFLAVSWHGPEKVDEESKAFHRLICFVREVCENEKLSWFIIGGYFNFDTSKVNLTELKGLETISRGRSFVLCKVTFAEDIIVSDVKHLELENESRNNPQLKHVPVMGVLKLVQDRALASCSSQSSISIPDGYVTRKDLEELITLMKTSFNSIHAKIDSLTADFAEIKLAIKRLDGSHGSDSQAQPTEAHSQTTKVSKSPVLEQGSDRESTSERKRK